MVFLIRFFMVFSYRIPLQMSSACWRTVSVVLSCSSDGYLYFLRMRLTMLRSLSAAFQRAASKPRLAPPLAELPFEEPFARAKRIPPRTCWAIMGCFLQFFNFKWGLILFKSITLEAFFDKAWLNGFCIFTHSMGR